MCPVATITFLRKKNLTEFPVFTGFPVPFHIPLTLGAKQQRYFQNNQVVVISFLPE